MKKLKLPSAGKKKITENFYDDPDYMMDWAYSVGKYQVSRETLKLIQDIYKFASRPTKNGAKDLRKKADDFEEFIKKGMF